MTFWAHIKELRGRLIKIMATLGILIVFLFAVGIRHTTINGITVYYVWPDVYHNVPAQLLVRAQRELVPSYVELIVTAPGEALFAEIAISIFLALLLGMPMILYHILAFVSPGLYPREKKLIRKIIVPATLLFVAGAAFSYFLILPFTFTFLYQYAVALGATTFITIDDFVTFTVMFLIALGASFQLPLIMIGLTYLGVIEPKFWKDNVRIIFVVITVFAAIITPDGSGVTMWFIVLPMMALYFVGYALSKRRYVKGPGLLG